MKFRTALNCYHCKFASWDKRWNVKCFIRQGDEIVPNCMRPYEDCKYYIYSRWKAFWAWLCENF
jgi:hypothetical protein